MLNDDRAGEIAKGLSRSMRLWLLDADRPYGIRQQRQVRDALIRRGLLTKPPVPIHTDLGLAVRKILQESTHVS